MKISVFCAASSTMDEVYHKEAARLGEWMAKNDCQLIFGGSDRGLMYTIARSVHDNGGMVIGIVPKILFANNWVSKYNTVTIPCEDLNDRKQLMVEKSDVFVVLPGSLGTLDEAFTVMSACSLGIHSKKVIFFNINHYWDELFQLFSALERKGGAHFPLSQAMDIANTFEELTSLLEQSL